MNRLLVAVFALSALFVTTGGCGNDLESELNNLGNQIEASLREGYNFDTCTETESTACASCCANAGFTSGGLFGDGSECGCTTVENNDTVCADATADLDTCASCCESNGYGSASRSNFGGETSCDCQRNSDQPN